MESLLSIDLTGQVTGYGSKLHQIVKALKKQRTKYAITGVLALGIYARARFTDTIEILCSSQDKLRIASSLGISTAPVARDLQPQAEALVKIVIREASITPEAFAVDAPRHVQIFYINVPLIKPEYFLWCFLAGTTSADRANAFTLIDSESIALPAFVEILDQHGAQHELAQLGQAQSTAHIQSSCYVDSVKARLSGTRRGRRRFRLDALVSG